MPALKKEKPTHFGSYSDVFTKAPVLVGLRRDAETRDGDAFHRRFQRPADARPWHFPSAGSTPVFSPLTFDSTVCAIPVKE